MAHARKRREGMEVRGGKTMREREVRSEGV